MTKIICTVTNDLTYDQRMIRICTSLANSGFEVILVGRQRPSSKEIIPQKFQQKRLKCYFEEGKFFYLEYNLRLFFWLLFQKFDIVNSIDLDTVLPGFFISKIKNKVCVYDAHEYFTEVPELVERPSIQRIWKGIAQFTIPKLKYCYTVCESLSHIFKEKYQTNFQVIRNVPFREVAHSEVTSRNLSELKAPPYQRVILYQGVLNDGRGIEQAIEAMKYIENTELWLAGEGDLSDELRKLVIDLDLSDKVKFLGYVLPHELKKITQQCTFGINLLKNKGLNYYYSLANKAFDYIQAEKPSVNMNFPEYQTINEEFGTFLLINNLEIETLVTAFQSLLNDDELFKELKMNCRKAKEVFVWEEEEKKLIEFYKLIIKTIKNHLD